MIEVRNLNKYYNLGKTKFQALNNINLTIEEGEFVAIQGKSGAGKSTLLHILGCLDDFDTGEYFLNGKPIKDLSGTSTAKIRNEAIGFILQDFSLITYRSVLFNVMLPLYFNNTPSRKMKAMALKALQLVGVEDQARKRVNQLSGGQRQRVAIARAIVNNPSMILADEPSGALDSETAKQIMELLKSMNEEGITVIVVTHDQEVADYCSRVINIRDGKIISNSGKNLARYEVSSNK